MGRPELHLWRATLLMGLQKTAGAEAPVVAGVQAHKAKFWPRGTQVISDVFRKCEKLSGHHRANCVAACVLGTGITGPIAEKTSQRLLRARREGQANNINFDIFLQVSAPALVPPK